MGVTGSVTVKVLPRPGSLSTDTDPPRASAVFFTRESPRPLPRYFREMEASACTKRSNMPSYRSFAMPMPSSSTASVSSRLRPS